VQPKDKQPRGNKHTAARMPKNCPIFILITQSRWLACASQTQPRCLPRRMIELRRTGTIATKLLGNLFLCLCLLKRLVRRPHHST
jgi:hypothetical protein